MRALVVYESRYDSTRDAARHVADGLRATHEVTVVPVAGATADLLAGTDLLVIGEPSTATTTGLVVMSDLVWCSAP